MIAKGTPFLKLAELCEALRGTTKKKEMAQLLGKFLSPLAKEEIAPAV